MNIDKLSIDFSFYDLATSGEVSENTAITPDLSLPSYDRFTIGMDMSVFINGKEIKGYIDPYILANFEDGSLQKSDNGDTYSNFYVLSCSCGSAGCASIWDGLYLEKNEKKNTISWIVPEDMGYDKTSLTEKKYTFNLNDYRSVFNETFERLKKKVKDSGWHEEVVEVCHSFAMKDFIEYVESTKSIS